MKDKPKDKPKGKAALSVPKSNALAQINADFEGARRWWHGTKAAAQMALFGAIMAGVELARLKEKHGVKRGGDRSAPPEHGLTWEDIVKKEMGFSAEWGGKLIQLGAGMEKKVKELAKLGDRAPSSLTDEELKALQKAIAKKTADVRTITELLQQIGVLKLKSSGGGGGTEGGAPPLELTLEQQARATVWPVQHALGTLADEANLHAYLLTLPLNPPDASAPLENEEQLAALLPMHDALERMAKAVEDAISHKKKEGRKA